MALGISNKRLYELHKYAEDHKNTITNETIKVCEIPAPGFKEQKRANYVLSRMHEFSLDSHIDEVGNVIAYKKANCSHKPNVMFVAHMDTVFPEGTDVKVKRKSHKLFAPGIRDNSAGVAGIIMLAKALNELTFLHGDIYLIGSVGEEGLGDLRGIKTAYKSYKDRVDIVVGVDGGLGGMISSGIGSRRLKVTTTAGGGHSWGAFGSPSAVHALGSMIAEIAKIKVPKTPRTTYNVGVIEGGTSINTIAASATMLIDMRSEQKKPLMDLESKVRLIIKNVATHFQVNAEIELVGDRPVGRLAKDHKLVTTVASILDYLKLPKHTGAGSTDCNVPLSDGKPAICVGITTGKNAHRLDESLDIEPMSKGLEQLMLLIELL